jgi:hypothetical protein
MIWYFCFSGWLGKELLWWWCACLWLLLCPCVQTYSMRQIHWDMRYYNSSVSHSVNNIVRGKQTTWCCYHFSAYFLLWHSKSLSCLVISLPIFSSAFLWFHFLYQFALSGIVRVCEVTPSDLTSELTAGFVYVYREQSLSNLAANLRCYASVFLCPSAHKKYKHMA